MPIGDETCRGQRTGGAEFSSAGRDDDLIEIAQFMRRYAVSESHSGIPEIVCVEPQQLRPARSVRRLRRHGQLPTDSLVRLEQRHLVRRGELERGLQTRGSNVIPRA